MPGLSVDALSVAVLPCADYVPAGSFATGSVPLERLEREHGVPSEHLLVLSPPSEGEDEGEGAGDGPDVSALVLAGLGVPATDEPLFFVRSGPLRDSMVASLAQLVHESGWIGEDVGVTHLEELGGTVVFDLLGWAVAQGGASVVVCDEPFFADARRGGVRFSGVGLRVRRGEGPLRVVACGEGAPGEAGAVDHRFGGRGPCDAWLAFHEALTAGRVADGQRILLGARGPLREGWLVLEAVDVAALRLAGAVS